MQVLLVKAISPYPTKIHDMKEAVMTFALQDQRYVRWTQACGYDVTARSHASKETQNRRTNPKGRGNNPNPNRDGVEY